MKKLIIVGLLAASSIAAAEEAVEPKITFSDRVSRLPTTEWVWQGLHLVDGLQTYQVALHPDKYRETNPLLGPNPSKGEVIGYTVGVAALHMAATMYFQEKYGVDSPSVKFFQYATLAIKGTGVALNFKVLF